MSAQSVAQLAQELGIHESTIRRKAKQALETNGVLKLGGRSYRVVLQSSRETRGKVYLFEALEKETVEVRFEGGDRAWLKASKKKRQVAMRRANLVSLWLARPPGMNFDRFMQQLPYQYRDMKISEASFFRWLKRYKEAKEQGVPPAYALLDTRGKRKGRVKLTPQMEELIVRMILEKPDRKIVRIYEFLQDEFEDVPSYVTVERFVKEWKERNFFVYEFAKNPDSAVGKFRPAGGKMDEAITYKNQLWELDATPADIICADGKRYILSAAIDVFSRRAVVVVEERADFSALGRLFKKAIKKLGVPEEVKTDNGRDYTSNNFDLMCSRLRINHVLVPPYSGYYKPFIERFFRTLSHDLFEELPGYIGHNVADREELVNRKSFKQRLEAIKRWRERYKNSDEFAKRFALKKENRGLEIELPLTKEELQSWIDRWIERYEKRRHASLRMSPLQKWQLCPMPPRRVSDERILDILTGFSVIRKVRKKGSAGLTSTTGVKSCGIESVRRCMCLAMMILEGSMSMILRCVLFVLPRIWSIAAHREQSSSKRRSGSMRNCEGSPN